MKTSASFKIKMIRDALAQGIGPKITLRDDTEGVFSVAAVRNHGHSLMIEIARGGGFIVIDPDDILTVWLPKLPEKIDPDADDKPFEVNIDE